MTFDEALAKVVEIIPSERMGDFDEVLETIKTSQTTENSWEEKYNDLVEKYKKRFTDSLNKEPENKEAETDTKVEVEIEPTVDNLDFSADSE
nr:MAG TPA: hypothetical protein [Caudoviricetes sp.]